MLDRGKYHESPLRFAKTRESGWSGRVQQAALKGAATDEPFDRGQVGARLVTQDWGSDKALDVILKGLVKDGVLVEIQDYAGKLWVSRRGAERLRGDRRYKVPAIFGR